MKLLSSLQGRLAFLGGNFLILIATWVLMNATGPISGTYQSLFFEEVLGANDFFLAVISFSGLLVLALVQFPGGYLADRHGRRWLVVTMTYGVALGFVFFVFAPSWPFIVVGLMMQNFFLLYQPALFALMLDSVPSNHRGSAFTIQSVVTSLVALPAPLIAGYLYLVYRLDLGMRIAYVVALVAYFAAATLRIRLTETLPSSGNDARPNLLDALRKYPSSVRESLVVWRKVPRSVLYLFIAATGVNSLLVSCQTYFVIYSTRILGIEKFQWSIVMAFMSLSIVIPTIFAGLRMDKVGRKRFFILGLLLYVPSMTIFLFANFYMLLLAFFFYGLAQMFQGTSYNSLLGDLTPRDMRGKVVGCSQFFMYLTQALVLLVAGALYASWPQLPFVLLAVGAFPLAVLVFFKVFDAGQKEV